MNGLEPTEQLGEREARHLTTRIQLLLDSAKSTLDRLEAAVVEAYERRADLALGYSSWADYADAEFSDKARYLPRSDRREFTIKLADRGLSTRAIAPVVGVSKSVVNDDLSGNRTPQPRPESPLKDVISDIESGAWRTKPLEPIPAMTRPVVGLDGKRYTEQPKREPQRRPITKQAGDWMHYLRKDVERLARLRADDRVPRNRAELRSICRGDLDWAIGELTALRDELERGR